MARNANRNERKEDKISLPSRPDKHKLTKKRQFHSFTQNVQTQTNVKNCPGLPNKHKGKNITYALHKTQNQSGT
jgi:hypothetical protein